LELSPGVGGVWGRRPGGRGGLRGAAAPPRAEYFYDDMHLSEAGARLVAQLVVGWVLELPPAGRPAGGLRP
jgi:hypothetical protein